MKTYTFYVGTAPAGEVISRTIELPGGWTLEDLHDAIQEAFGLDRKAKFSFYMSGEAWDEASEYTHLDEIEDNIDEELSDILDAGEDDDLWGEDEEEDEPATLDAEAASRSLAPFDADQEASVEDEGGAPSAQDIRAMFAELKTNPELRAQLTAQLADQLKLPSFMLDAVLSNADAFLSMMPDDSLNQMLAQGFDEITDDEGPVGDTRETRLEDLALTSDQEFLYLYDYDLEQYFSIQVDEIQESELPEEEFPRLLESVGELPAVEEEE